MTAPIRALLVDDDDFFRRAFAARLRFCTGLLGWRAVTPGCNCSDSPRT